MILLIVLLVAAAAAAGLVIRGFARFRRLPANRPANHRPQTGRPTVVLLGASTIQGNVSFNIVDELARRLPEHDLVNAGINGDTSAQALARVPEVVACRPDAVVVHIGANDALAIRGSAMARNVVERPTLDSYAANLAAIVQGLAATGARIALMSIQPVGEQPDAEINKDGRQNQRGGTPYRRRRGCGLPSVARRLTALLAERGTGRPPLTRPCRWCA
jgi:lysophospholipase L1-like esterase